MDHTFGVIANNSVQPQHHENVSSISQKLYIFMFNMIRFQVEGFSSRLAGWLAGLLFFVCRCPIVSIVFVEKTNLSLLNC